MSDLIECRNHTQGRRYPMVLGRIRDIVLPWPITMPQLAAGLAGLAVVLAARPLWRALLGSGAITGLIVVTTGVVVPVVVSRPIRIEGRSLPAAIGGRVRLWLAPAGGMAGSRRASRPRRFPGARLATVSYLTCEVDRPAPRQVSSTAGDVVSPAPVWSSLR